ncbi:fatty acid desaturase 4, chloroplastic-like [Andrographis paniculata]|uniref:fatty acid desaturase 4, chloroplastic-like n=1 Tax=Andrographis paniculata TaxID=175694 RepID=UPI0021E99D5E|nr:fatty acid desaturase 4, chloroplastic-like [Andrographis paniculata]
MASNSSTVRSSAHQNPSSSGYATWQQRAWFTGGCAAVTITLARSVILTAAGAGASDSWWPWILLVGAAVAGYVASDFSSGIYHWAIDNYGSAATPFFGSQVAGFLGHHHRPAEIVGEPIASNLEIPSSYATVAGIPINILCGGNAAALGFMGAYAAASMFGQHFHMWAHTPKGRLPAAVVALQDAGILLGRADHAAHHRPPFDCNYCIVSGLCNRVLERWRFFPALEAAVFAAVGVRPRSWSDPSLVINGKNN